MIQKYDDFEYIRESWNKEIIQIKTEWELSWDFLDKYDLSNIISIIDTLLLNTKLDSDSEIHRNTSVILTLCSLAIAFGEHKSTYKKFFEELRLRGVYESLKKCELIYTKLYELCDCDNIKDLLESDKLYKILKEITIKKIPIDNFIEKGLNDDIVKYGDYVQMIHES
jgi:hypothetical protein